jgi:hypothetical protein
MGRCMFLGLGALFSLVLIGAFEWSYQRGIFFVQPCVKLTYDDIAAAKEVARIPKHHAIPVTVLLTTPPAPRATTTTNNDNGVTNGMSVTQLSEMAAEATLARTTTRHVPPPDIPTRTIITVPANYPSTSTNNDDNDNDSDNDSSKSVRESLGSGWPSSRDCMPCRGITLVTGVSNAAVQSLANLVGSIHRYIPDCPLVIYDMGLQPVISSPNSLISNHQ